MGRNRRPLNSC